jgi:hypothetical protein
MIALRNDHDRFSLFRIQLVWPFCCKVILHNRIYTIFVSCCFKWTIPTYGLRGGPARAGGEGLLAGERGLLTGENWLCEGVCERLQE